MRVIQNGVLVPIEKSDCNDKGWMSGNGVFETIKTVDNKPWALSDTCAVLFPVPNRLDFEFHQKIW